MKFSHHANVVFLQRSRTSVTAFLDRIGIPGCLWAHQPNTLSEHAGYRPAISLVVRALPFA